MTPQGEPEVLNRTTEPKSSVAGARARGTATVAELSATAVRPDAYRLVAEWREQTGTAYRPATVRALAKVADGLLRDGANPTAVRAALDEWHRRPDARPGLLPHLYDDAVKAAHHATKPPSQPATRSTRGDKVRGWLQLAAEADYAESDPVERLALGGGTR